MNAGETGATNKFKKYTATLINNQGQKCGDLGRLKRLIEINENETRKLEEYIEAHRQKEDKDSGQGKIRELVYRINIINQTKEKINDSKAWIADLEKEKLILEAKKRPSCSLEKLMLKEKQSNCKTIANEAIDVIEQEQIQQKIDGLQKQVQSTFPKVISQNTEYAQEVRGELKNTLSDKEIDQLVESYTEWLKALEDKKTLCDSLTATHNTMKQTRELLAKECQEESTTCPTTTTFEDLSTELYKFQIENNENLSGAEYLEETDLLF